MIKEGGDGKEKTEEDEATRCNWKEGNREKEVRHHNNKGLRQIKRDKTHKQVDAMARRLRHDERTVGKIGTIESGKA